MLKDFTNYRKKRFGTIELYSDLVHMEAALPVLYFYETVDGTCSMHGFHVNCRNHQIQKLIISNDDHDQVTFLYGMKK